MAIRGCPQDAQREIEGVMLGASSSRAAIHLMSATKANARLEGATR